jgi:hypothetical protein
MVYCFDIDGTICSNMHGQYEQAEPCEDLIQMINRLYERGDRIILFTARGSETQIDWRACTEQQLRQWKVKYHELRFGKPNADVYVDDRAVNDRDWLRRMMANQSRHGGLVSERTGG